MVKKHTCLTIESGLLNEAKEKKLNISAIAEEALRKELCEVIRVENCKEKIFCCVCGKEAEEAYRCENTKLIYCKECSDVGMKMCLHKFGEHYHFKIK